MIGADKLGFSKWLREVALSRKPFILSPQALSEMVGVHADSVRSWLHGRSTPPRTVAPRLASALGVTVEEMEAACGGDLAYGVLNDARKTVERDLRRERYQTDRQYRELIRSRQACPVERLSPARKHQIWVMSLPEQDRLAFLRYRRSEKKAKKRTRLLKLGEDFTAKEFWAKTKSLGYVCCYCGISRAELAESGKDLTADHVYPLVLVDDPERAHLASNSIDAVFPACFSCNSSKSDRDLMDWAKWKGLADRLHPAVVRHYHEWPKTRAKA